VFICNETQKLAMREFATANSFRGASCEALLALALLCPASGVFADDKNQAPAPPPAVAPATTVQAPPQPAYRPGFLEQLKVWLNDSVAVFDRKGGGDEAAKKPEAMPPAPAPAPGAKDGAKDGPKDTSKEAATEAPRNAPPEPPKNVTTPDPVTSAVEATKGVAAGAMKNAVEATKNAVEATKNAASALVRLPNTRVVEIREACTRAPNGGSDCTAAAANGCRGKGYADGKPLDVRTAEKCDAKPAQAGQTAGVRCGVETVVIRAVCQ
jgi:hypothetical protein